MFSRKRIERVESESTHLESAESEEVYSLEDLGSAYAQALDLRERDPERPPINETPSESESIQNIDDTTLLNAPNVDESDHVSISAESILESMLFVGTTDNRPIELSQFAEILKGSTVDDIHQLVDRLNSKYREQDRTFEIAYEAGGYRLQLSHDFALIRDRFYGKTKETQLSQAAIDCLSLVAYQPGITQPELETQWNQPAGMTLSTLVRKGLLRIDNEGAHRATPKYFTTDRFLEIVGLHSLNDLPHSEET